MNELTPELLSRYVDGEVTAEEAAAVRAALEGDVDAQAALDELLMVDALFGRIEPEPISPDLRRRLQELRSVPRLVEFRAAPVASPRPRAVGTWIGAVAAAVLAAVGVVRLATRVEVTLPLVSRVALDETGGRARAMETRRDVVLRAGARLSTGPRERLSLRFADESEVVLLPEAEMVVGDPAERLFALERGAALVKLRMTERQRTIEAAGVPIVADNAVFGVRIDGPVARPMGAAAAPAPLLTIAVTLGALGVRRGGTWETVGAGERVRLGGGAVVERTPAWRDELYAQLLRVFRAPSGGEIAAGYFAAEKDVFEIPADRWAREGDRLVYVIPDGWEVPGRSTHLVLEARAARGGEALLTRVLPASGGIAATATVRAGALGRDWTVLAVPLVAFDAPTAERGERPVPESRSRLARLELRADSGTAIEIACCLWAARPPAETSEVLR